MSNAKLIRSYKYRLYPNKTQEAQLTRIFGIARHTYNCIALEAQARYERGEKFNAYAIRDLFCAQRHEFAELQLLPGKTVEDLVRRYEKAMKAFWRKDAKAGFPKLKDSRTFTGLGYVYGVGVKFIEDRPKVARLRLWKVDGLIRVQLHRPLPANCKIKHVMVTRDGEQWYACFQMELSAPAVLPSNKPAVGIDMGLVSLISLSDGTQIDHPKWYDATQYKRSKYQVRIDRQRRANNPQNYNENGVPKTGVFIWHKSARQKINEKLARKVDRKAKNQRWYFWHVVTTWLVQNYGVIVLEDLNLDFMLKNGHLARRAHDAGLGAFMSLLESKAAAHGVQVVKVNPAYTSQTCSYCGHVTPENRTTQALSLIHI
jgi:putative transposase